MATTNKVNTIEGENEEVKKEFNADPFLVMMYIIVIAIAILVFGSEFYLKNFM